MHDLDIGIDTILTLYQPSVVCIVIAHHDMRTLRQKLVSCKAVWLPL